MVSSVVAMVLAGQRSDRHGPRGTLVAGLAVFAAGLVVAGTAHLMSVFVVGRAVQGMGAGAIIVSLYVVIAEVYEESMRPRVAALVPALRRLLPPGTLMLRRGLPAALGYRGVLAGAFFGADTFVPLTLTQVHGYGAAAAGAPLIAGALGWFGGSWWQARRAEGARYRLVRLGCGLIGAGAAGLVVVAWAAPPGRLAAVLWVFAGFGVGISMASVSVLMLRLSPEGIGKSGAN